MQHAGTPGKTARADPPAGRRGKPGQRRLSRRRDAGWPCRRPLPNYSSVPAQSRRPERSQSLHDSARPPNAAAGSARHPITLPKGEQVGINGIDSITNRIAHPEAGHHLVDDQQRAVLGGDSRSAALKPGSGATAPMLPGQASVITRDALAELCKASSTASMSSGQHDGVGGRRAGDTGRGRQTQGCHPGAGVGE